MLILSTTILLTKNGSSILSCKDKRQYLITCNVSRYTAFCLCTAVYSSTSDASDLQVGPIGQTVGPHVGAMALKIAGGGASWS